MADTLLDIEKKVKTIYKNRKEIEKLNLVIGAYREDVIKFLKEKGKNFTQIGDYSIIIKTRDKTFADYELIQKKIDEGLLPPETLKISKIELLQVSSKADFELKGNKFVKK